MIIEVKNVTEVELLAEADELAARALGVSRQEAFRRCDRRPIQRHDLRIEDGGDPLSAWRRIGLRSVAKQTKAVPGIWRKKQSLHRSSWLIVYGGNTDRWEQRHGLERFTHPCVACGAQLTTTIPFVIRDSPMRGLVAPKCACGNERTPYCIVGLPGL